ncbi:LacI family DNA-binding transcriptional regulator [Telmatospirillum sp. J64-1]|uniref:LacI family DNA-binding transcriptional regulator n=1 Tax=Telmatospirillum sp. J64-1 TaxID=2502183 RepID=UPI00115E314E|nr:LacI family DNA-binding transcriptional regulator [Telmatospirillum sp. J64-1]
MSVTIRDVAAYADVSVATVSRLLNGSKAVRTETAERIHQAIEILGFRPNIVGRSLKTSRTMMLGVVIPSLANPVFADTVSGIETETRQEGYTLLFGVSGYDADDEIRAVEALLRYRVDGLVLTVVNPERNAALDLLDASGVPYALVYNQPSRPGTTTVTVDNETAGRMVAESFASFGHHRLAMISGRFSASDRASARRDGFLAGARARGLADPVVLEVDFDSHDLEGALASLFAPEAGAPSAVFCSNDMLAISVIGGLGRLGLRVPEDVSVFGFDGIAVGAHMHPTLATVVQPSREMGREAARQLVGRLNGGLPAGPVILPYTLRSGETVGNACQPSPTVSRAPDHSVQQGKHAP